MNPVRFFAGKRASKLMVVALLGVLGGCAGLMDGIDAREVDWRRVNNVESNAQKIGAQIIWLHYPERNVIAPAVVKADKPI